MYHLNILLKYLNILLFVFLKIVLVVHFLHILYENTVFQLLIFQFLLQAIHKKYKSIDYF
jgi:hypothetical protein